ncbi:MAG: secretin N-terminal domain-containing protein [Planctomycetota bacterium]
MRSYLSGLMFSALLLSACNTAPPAARDADLIQVVRLEHVQAAELATTLQAFAAVESGDDASGGPRLRVVPDASSNSIVLNGSASGIDKMLELIARLDVANDGPRQPAFSVVYLKHVRAKDMATTLNQFLAQDAAASGAERVVVTSHEGSNSLLIQASDEKYRQIVALAERFDVETKK